MPMWRPHKATPASGGYTTASSALLHPLARGLAYNDPRHPTGQQAAKTFVTTFACPSTPIRPGDRDPAHGYAPFDYMFAAVSDIDAREGSPTYRQRTPASDPQYLSQVVAGMLSCDGIVCRKICALVRIPVLLGYKPVSIELRLGPHNGNEQ